MHKFADAGFNSYAIRLRGHSVDRRARVNGTETIADYTEDVISVAKALPRPLVLVGHSAGGLLAGKAAEVVEPDALVLIATAQSGFLSGLRVSALAQLAPQVARALLRRPWRPGNRTLKRLMLGDVDDHIRRFALRLFVPESGTAAYELLRDATGGWPENIGCPVYIGNCRRDRVARPVRKYPWADTIVRDHNLGHIPMIEPGGDRMCTEVINYLDDRL